MATALKGPEVVEVGELPQVSRDLNDNRFLAAAEAAHAAYLITEDQDLLVLAEYQGTAIITTVSFLRILQEMHGEGDEL